MSVSELTNEEQQLIGRCLYEAANGNLLPEWEFEILIGETKQAVRKAASRWLTAQEITSDTRYLTASVLGNLIGYPHKRTAYLEGAVGAPMSRIRLMFEKLRD